MARTSAQISKPREPPGWRGTALWIVGGYLACAAAWIVGSDLVISRLGLSLPAERVVCTAKDVLFAAITAATLYALIARWLMRQRAYQEEERGVLELLARGAPVSEVLDAIVRMVEEQDPGTLASILVLEGRRAFTAAAPSLPAEYSRAIDGLEIGPEAGSCGTAMHSGRRVIVADLDKSPLWEKYKSTALPHGLRACWSEPIFGTGGDVLGSFAMYYKTARSPTEREISLIATAAHLAGIAIERRRADEALRASEATKRALLDAVPDLMFRMDRHGRYLDYHAPDPARLLVPPEQFLGKRAAEVLSPEYSELCMRHLENLFRTGAAQTYEYDSRRSGRFTTWEVRMVRSGADEALLLLRDITDRRRAETRLRDSESRLSLLIRNTPLGVIFWDEQFHIASWNPGAERIFGFAAHEAIGNYWTLIVPYDQRPYVMGITAALMSNTGGSRGTNRNVRKDGRIVYCEWYNTPLVDEAGRVVGAASVVEEVTERLEAEKGQELMLRELDHRVKNNLASIASLAEQTGRSARDKGEFIESFTGRLRAMGRLHSLLARSHGRGVDLRLLVRQTLDTFGAGGSPRTAMNGPSVVLDARAGQALAMALNELATNATKYGALSIPGGRVNVAWSVTHGEGNPRLQLIWSESGGPAVRAPERRGFGTELIRGQIAHELGGRATIDFQSAGVRCTLEVPLPAPASPGEHTSAASAIGGVESGDPLG